MELYITKKMTVDDDFVFPSCSSLPFMHVVTPPVEIKSDAFGGLYIATCSEDPHLITKLVKLKKIAIGKQQKLADDIIWVKPSPLLLYKNNATKVYCTKVLLGFPMKLQLSCKQSSITTYEKPYSTSNFVWTIDTIIVPDEFDFGTLV